MANGWRVYKERNAEMKKLMLLWVWALLCAPAFAEPAKYAYLEYVQAEKDLYVDIDYIPKCDTVIECEVAIDNVDRNNTIFCSRDSDQTLYTLFYINNKSTDNFRFDYHNSTSRKADLGKDDPIGTRYYLRTSKAGLELFGKLAENVTPQIFKPKGKMILFASYSIGKPNDAKNNYSRMKIYSFRIFDKDEEGVYKAVCDLRPAKDEEGGVGLHDAVREVFYKSAVENQLTAGPGITVSETSVPLRDDVLLRGHLFAPGGTTKLEPYGCTNLFDGVKYTTSTTTAAWNARWIGNDASEQFVEIDSGYFQERAGTLLSYTVHKISMSSYAHSARAPTSWRLEGVLATRTDDFWTVIDTRTDVLWPGVTEYVYDGNEEAPAKEDASLTFAVDGTKQAPYRKLRFVPTNSKMKEHGDTKGNIYGLMEVEFFVKNAKPGADVDSVFVTGTPDAYGMSSPTYGTHTGFEAGQTANFEIPEVVFANPEKTLRAICEGWKVYTYNEETRTWSYDEGNPDRHGTGNAFTYTHPTPAVPTKVEWQFRMQAYVDVAPFGGGTVTGSGWYDLGTEVEISATPEGTNFFRRWEDLPDGADGSAALTRFTVTRPVAPKASIGGIRYVAKSGDDEANTGLSDGSPFLTINHALADLGVAGGTVYVGEGTYNETNGVDLAAINVTNEVSLVGATGRAEDVKVSRVSAGSTRHVIVLNHPRASARYMTFFGGNATTVQWGNSDAGMNVRIGGKGGVIEDCVIRGASGSGWSQHGLGIFLYGGRASRCRIMNNSSTADNSQGGAGLGASAGLIEDCLIASNSCMSAGAVYLTGTATMLNCTITANTGTKYAGVYCDSDNVRVINCAIFGNVAKHTPEGKVYRGTTAVYANCASDLEIPGATDCLVGQSGFREASNGDYRPGASSICLDAGLPRVDYGAVGATDLAGLPRVAGENVDIGCYENQRDELECGFTWSVDSYVLPSAVTLTAASSVTDGAEYGWAVTEVLSGETTVIPPSEDNVCVFNTTRAGVYSVTLTVTAGGGTASHTESEIFRLSPSDLYVDAKSQSPVYPYGDWGSAATDIATALTAAADGATVHVAKGEYGIADQISVEKDVRLVGETGRPGDVVVRRTSGNVRNLLVNHPNAWVANMTFADGRVAGHGGVLYINGNGGTVTNCVLTGGRTTANNDYSAGGVLITAGLLTHSVITDCTAVHKDGGSQVRTVKMLGGRLSNCLITGNVADYSGPLISLATDGARIENCTIVSNVVRSGSKVVDTVKGTRVCNCAIFATDPDGNYASCGGSDVYAAFWPQRYINCVTKGMLAEYTTANGGKGWYRGINCVTNVTEVDCFVSPDTGDYRARGDGALFNAGTNEVGVLPSVDLAGKPRIHKNVIDVGCYEFNGAGFLLLVR